MPSNRSGNQVIDRHVAKIAVIDALLLVEPVLERGEIRLFVALQLRGLAFYLLPHDQVVSICESLKELVPFQCFVTWCFACLDASGSEVSNEVVIHPARNR